MGHRLNLAIFALALLQACNVDPYRLESSTDGGRRDAPVDAAGDRADARPGTQPDGAPRPDAANCEAERCDGLDNDCDGVADNGFNFTADPENCGSCGNACDDAQANQRGSCQGGKCVYTCAGGFVDCTAAPGCETACIKTNGGVEACDGIDNDCDCQTDEGFVTDSDPLNCGSCLHVCIALHATPTCTAGVCGVGACEPGYKDLRADLNGCEYRCPIFPPLAADTTCDGVDDDCDGTTDEDVPGTGGTCATGSSGECTTGTVRCVNGRTSCVPQKNPTPEICDGKDNDCDGRIDNGFDKQNDPAHCGASCTECKFDNAFAGCSSGQCVVLGCEPGWTDADGQPGCEYQCEKSGPEVCDGLDNDCDHQVDAADPDLIRPSASFCASAGACTGATLACQAPPQGCGDSTVAWRCVYPGGAQTDSCGNLLPQETLCDGIDNDCDNVVDDAFPQVGSLCADDGLGECRSTGKYECDANDPAKQKVVCRLTNLGADPNQEICNGKDDDCNGKIDDDALDEMVHVASGGEDFWVYKYEASHPDATSGAAGGSTARACSRQGVMPWALVSWTQANQACMDAGKRLCTEEEWQIACGGDAGNPYPYGTTYQPQYCNGNDYDPDCTGPDDDRAQPTGTKLGCPPPPQSRCASVFAGAGSVFDMSGNLREWTSTAVGDGLYRIRGGGYDNVAEALTCDFDFWSQEPDSYYFNLGFRCCSEVAP